MTNIYIFDFGNRIKIGRTGDVQKRLRQIENSSGQKAKQFFYVEAPPECEKEIHKKFEQYRTVGEYFNCSYGKAVTSLQKISLSYIKKHFTKSEINNKIRAIIEQYTISWSTIQKYLGISDKTLSNKIIYSKFTEFDLEKICAVLGVQPGDIMEYVQDTKAGE